MFTDSLIYSNGCLSEWLNYLEDDTTSLVRTTFTYDFNNLLLKKSSFNGDGKLISEENYVYDEHNNLIMTKLIDYVFKESYQISYLIKYKE